MNNNGITSNCNSKWQKTACFPLWLLFFLLWGCGTARDLTGDRAHLPESLAVINTGSSMAGESAVFKYTASFRDSNTPVEFLWDFWGGTQTGGTVERYSTASNPSVQLRKIAERQSFSGSLTLSQDDGDRHYSRTYDFTYEVLPFSFELGNISWDAETYDLPVKFTVELLPPGHSEEDFSYAWDFHNGTELFAHSELVHPVLTFNDSLVGSYQVSVTVSPLGDPANERTSQAEFRLQPATVMLGSITPQSGLTGDQVVFSVATEPVGNYEYEWDFGQIGTAVDDQDAQPLVTLGAPSELKLNGSVRVFVPGHRAETEQQAQFLFSVNPDLAIYDVSYQIGTADYVIADPQASGTAGQLMRWKATVTDGNGTAVPDDELEYKWDFGDATSTIQSSLPNPVISLDKDGEHVAGLTVSYQGSDQESASRTRAFVINVAPSQADFSLGTVAGASGSQGSEITLEIEVKEADGSADYPTPESLDYSWDFRQGEAGPAAIPDQSSSQSTTVVLGQARELPYTCSVTVKNPDLPESSLTRQFALLVEPGELIITLLPISDVTIGTNEQFTLFAVAGGAVPKGTVYNWNVPGEQFQLTPSSNGLTVMAKAVGLFENLSVTATDPNNQSNKDSTMFNITVAPMQVLDVSPKLVAKDAEGVKFKLVMKYGQPTSYLWDFGSLGTTTDVTDAEPVVNIAGDASMDYTVKVYLDNPYEDDIVHQFTVHVQ
jgi:PKD repeat protein